MDENIDITTNTPTQAAPPKQSPAIILLSALVFVLIGGIIFLFLTNSRIIFSQKTEIESLKQMQNPIKDGIKTFGIIRTSGLNPDEKQKLMLSNTDFQITNGEYRAKEDEVVGYYLISDLITKDLIGKCVMVSGIIPEEWRKIPIRDSYSRSALNVRSIEIVSNNNCDPYPKTSVVQDQPLEKKSHTGTVVKASRPAPDIGYDYELKLKTPFIDSENASGLSQKINSVVIIPDTFDVWLNLEKNMGQEIEVTGYYEWGYAESKYFRIVNILNTNDQ